VWVEGWRGGQAVGGGLEGGRGGLGGVEGGGGEVGGGRGLQSLTQRRRIHREEDIRTLGPESQLGPYGQACRMGVPHPPPPFPSRPSFHVCPSSSRRGFLLVFSF
jgi:hypothetical protein